MRIALIALLAAFVVPVAGAGSTGGSVNLVAYSTPKAAFATIIPAFNGTAAGTAAARGCLPVVNCDVVKEGVNGFFAITEDMIGNLERFRGNLALTSSLGATARQTAED